MPTLKAGDRAPAFTLTDQHGKKVKLSQPREVSVLDKSRRTSAPTLILSCRPPMVSAAHVVPAFQDLPGSPPRCRRPARRAWLS